MLENQIHSIFMGFDVPLSIDMGREKYGGASEMARLV
jgi:hypothetical protein